MSWYDGGIGALIGGAFSAFGASRQNREAEQAAATQMAFQEKTLKNQYQWGMADMKQAGLNPILAYKQGGAGSAGGSSYTPANVGQSATQGAQVAANSAMANRRLNAEVKNIEQDTYKKNAETFLNNSLGRNAVDNGLIIRENLHSARAAAAVAKEDKDFYESNTGKLMRWIDRVGTSLNPFTSSTGIKGRR